MLKQGKVVEFDNYIGYITDDENEYMFLDFDLSEPINIGDIVIFKAEKIGEVYRAFFIEKSKDLVKTGSIS